MEFNSEILLQPSKLNYCCAIMIILFQAVVLLLNVSGVALLYSTTLLNKIKIQHWYTVEPSVATMMPVRTDSSGQAMKNKCR